jgi:hypothetical protein
MNAFQSVVFTRKLVPVLIYIIFSFCPNYIICATFWGTSFFPGQLLCSVVASLYCFSVSLVHSSCGLPAVARSLVVVCVMVASRSRSSDCAQGPTGRLCPDLFHMCVIGRHWFGPCGTHLLTVEHLL